MPIAAISMSSYRLAAARAGGAVTSAGSDRLMGVEQAQEILVAAVGVLAGRYGYG